MKKILSLLLFLSSLTFAEVATKSDISDLRSDMKENTKLLIESIKSNQKATNQRFEDMQKATNQRFEEINNKFYIVMALLIVIMGYLMKERQIIKKEVLEDVKEEINKKAGKNFVDDVIKVFEEFAKTNKDIAEVLQNHKIRVN